MTSMQRKILTCLQELLISGVSPGAAAAYFPKTEVQNTDRVSNYNNQTIAFLSLCYWFLTQTTTNNDRFN